MRYLLLILLLAGGYYGWDYYQNGLAPRHEALKAMEQEPCPELDAAQARFDEAAELHEQQAVRLQKAVQRKEEAVRKYWDSRIKQAGQEKDGKKTPSPVNGRPNARSAEARIAYLLEQYDRRVAEVEKLKSRRNATRQQLDSARNRIQEQIRQVETRLDINRIQRAEASNKKSGDFKVTENRADLLKLQASLPQELERITDRRVAEVEKLKSRRNATRQQLDSARNRIQEQIRQVETRLDINRIQRAEASNKKSGDFKVTENRADLLKLQASLPQELERITDQGEAALRDQTEAYEKAKRELGLFQNNVDRQIASLRDSMNSPLAEDYDETEILSEDPEFRTMIAPYDQAVSHEETIVMRTEADVEEKAKALHGLQRVRDAKIEEERNRLRQEEEIFFTAATVIGVILLISILLSFARRR